MLAFVSDPGSGKSHLFSQCAENRTIPSSKLPSRRAPVFVATPKKNSDILRTPWRRARRVAKALRPRSYNQPPRSYNRPAARVFGEFPAHRPRARLAQQKNPDHEAPPARPLTPQSALLLSLNRHPPDVLPSPTQYSHPPDPDSPGTGKAGSGARSKEHPVGPGGL